MKIPIKTARRDLLKFAGGGAFGLLLTPAPWRLMRDTAVWSQNWSWIPQPLRGEIKTRFTQCTLCEAGCAVKARCVGDQPVLLSSVAGERPLCAAGIGAHQLPWHPDRVRTCAFQGKPISADEAIAKVKAALNGRLGVLDAHPGRAASLTYRAAIQALPSAVYLEPARFYGATLRALERITGTAPLAFDVDKAKTILSFGTPVLEGWTAPARVLGKAKLIQVEAGHSRTGSLAHEWIGIPPGTESIFAAGVGNALLHAGLKAPADMAELLAHYPVPQVEYETGVGAAQIEEIASRLLKDGPALILADGALPDQHTALIAALNLIVGTTAILPRRELPLPEGVDLAPATELSTLPDRSLDALLCDESTGALRMPWKTIESKLAPNALVIAFTHSPHGVARHASLVIPTAVFPEATSDSGTAHDDPAAGYRVASALQLPPAGVLDPVAILGGAALLDARADAIYKTKRGTVHNYADNTNKPLKEFASAEDVRKALAAGASWNDELQEHKPFKQWSLGFRSLAPAPARDTVLAVSEFGAGALPVPMLGKLYRESDLYAANVAALHPETARANGVSEGMKIRIEARSGWTEARVTLDAALPKGVIEYAAPPGRTGMDLCEGRWTPAKVVRA